MCPEGIGAMATDLTQNASTALAAARAIEHHLSTYGYYLNENTQFSRPGVRADRLERMISSDENLIGDDQQYTALMASCSTSWASTLASSWVPTPRAARRAVPLPCVDLTSAPGSRSIRRRHLGRL